MKLSREQFDELERLYEKRRRQARKDARERREAFLEAHPHVAELEKEIIILSGDLFKATLDRDETRRAFLAARRRALIKEKQDAFIAAGLTGDGPAPQYSCPYCQDTGWIGSQECSCRRKLVIDLFYSDSVLWKRTEKENFQTFSLDWYDHEKKLPDFQGLTCREVMAVNLQAAQAYVAGFDKNRAGVLMTGPVGTGKTFLCNCIAGALMEKDYSVLYLSAQELFDEVTALTFEREEKDSGLAEQFGEADLLIIDDLGTEFTSRKLAANALFTILNERIIQNRGTLISTNLDLDELAERYSDPVASRLIGEFHTMRFAGGDIRLAKRLQ